MEKRTQGAWLINHSRKLYTTNAPDFEDIELAGKCGVFLSNLAASDEQSDLNADMVSAIAKVSNVKKSETESVKKILSEAHLIDIGSDGGLSVLGVATSSVLNHTSDIFSNLNPNNFQKAAIELSENISDLPKDEKKLKEFISDTYQLDSSSTKDLFYQSEEIGFVDFENLDDSKLYFNGNLFKRENIQKTSKVLQSLKSDETRKISEVDQLLTSKGCLTIDKAKEILGDQLLLKLQSIGMYDFNEVSNSQESRIFVTKPGAFAKYGDPFEEDALDLAKAFVSALYYGMNFSASNRGRITMLKALMNRLVQGYEVGPATAIGEDYKLLELKRVIKLRLLPGTDRYYMKLLKKDVGELALQVLEFGDTTHQTVVNPTIFGGSVTNYVGPESNRTINRKKQTVESKVGVANLLRTFRK